jgi:hypothetical protein
MEYFGTKCISDELSALVHSAVLGSDRGIGAISTYMVPGSACPQGGKLALSLTCNTRINDTYRIVRETFYLWN